MTDNFYFLLLLSFLCCVVSGGPAEVMEKGLNTELYWKNDDPTHTVSMVPTSAISGEGIPDLLLWLVRLTQVCCALHFTGMAI